MSSAYYQVLDKFLAEMSRRFKENSDILLAISDSNEFSFEKLKPLEKIGLKLPSQEELTVAKAYIDRKREDHNKERELKNDTAFKTRFNLLQTLYNMKEAFPEVYRLMAAIDVFGSSSVICECSFSAVERIGSTKRVNMDDERLRQLSFLAFESKRVSNIPVELVLKRFNENPKRRIQLY